MNKDNINEFASFDEYFDKENLRRRKAPRTGSQTLCAQSVNIEGLDSLRLSGSSSPSAWTM